MRKLSHFQARPCENKNCKWNKDARRIDKEHLCVDEFDNIFMIGTFMCECSYHVRVEPIFVEIADE